MKRGNCISALKVILLVFTVAGTHLIQAQQSYFNVPSSDRTKEGEFFFQQQLNYAEKEITSNSTFDWGITKHFEVGLNVLQVNYLNGAVLRRSDNEITPDEMVYPLITANCQYFFPISEHHQFSVAAVSGFSFLNKLSLKENAVLVFSNYQYHKHGLKITAGIYAGNNHMMSTGTRFPFSTINSPLGFQIGSEIPIIHEKLSIITDYVSGTHAMGMSTLGIAVAVPHHWVISLGGFFPNINSVNPKGIVMEFTRSL